MSIFWILGPFLREQKLSINLLGVHIGNLILQDGLEPIHLIPNLSALLEMSYFPFG